MERKSESNKSNQGTESSGNGNRKQARPPSKSSESDNRVSTVSSRSRRELLLTAPKMSVWMPTRPPHRSEDRSVIRAQDSSNPHVCAVLGAL